jgi:competence protein ComGF
MKSQNILHKRIAEFKAFKQVNHQRLTSVNSYIEQSVFQSLNSVIKYVKYRNDRIRAYQKQIKQETISFCTEIHNIMQFTIMLLFSRPAAAGYARPCDMGTLCI